MAELKILASPGVRAAINALIPEFERATGHRVSASYDVIAVLRRRIDAGESFDIVVPSPELIDQLAQQGKVAAETKCSFARTGLGVAAAKDKPRPDIATVDAFKRALLAAGTVTHSREGASGTNFLAVLEQLGIAEAMRPRLLASAGGNPIKEGRADLAVTGMGPAMEIEGAQFLGGLPAGVQRYVVFAAGISAASAHPAEARALLRHLTESPQAAAVFRDKGLER
jgi:molybdate transport system substrate-binding protein